MKTTISVLVENHAGVLSRVAGLFSRRAYNIDSLAVGVTEDKSLSRITIVVDGNENDAEQVVKQLTKLIDVVSVKKLPENENISRELILIKIAARPEDRAGIANVCQIMGARVADISLNSMTLELSDTADRIEIFAELVRPYGLKELVRTGTIALQRGSEAMNQKK